MTKEAWYRLKVAQGFLGEARQDIDLQRWRSTVDNAQLAVENSVKAVLALIGPVGRTHNPAPHLRRVLDNQLFTSHRDKLERLVKHTEMMGPDIHIQTDYGDEVGGRTPWELFDESDAHQALTIADESVRLAEQIITDLDKEINNESE
jgi:HEPN domain-containing protein